MRAAIVAGALAALLYGTGARAAERGAPAAAQGSGAELSQPERSLVTQRTPPPGEPTGNDDAPEIPAADTQSGVGGSGDAEVVQQPEPQGGTGGSGTATDRPVATPPPAPPAAPLPPAPPPVPAEPSYTVTPTDEQKYEPRTQDDMRGLTVTLGGGVEGYTQALAPAVSPGPAVAVNATLRPTRVLGFELGYSGAVHEIKQEDNVNGADIVRNGGQAALTVGLSATPVQPYLLGGIGVSSYNVRDPGSARFQDDTVGNVPLGAGLRTHMGNFTADARVNYSFLFDQEFARNTPTEDVGSSDIEFSEAGLYNATLNFGVTF